MAKHLESIAQGALRRRFALGLAGAKSGLGLLSAKAVSLTLPKAQQQQHQKLTTFTQLSVEIINPLNAA